MLLSNKFRIFKQDEGAYDGAPTFRFKLLKAEPFHLDEDVPDGDAAIEVFKVMFGGGDGTDAVEAGGDLTCIGATYGLGPAWLIEVQSTRIHCHTLCSSPKMT